MSVLVTFGITLDDKATLEAAICARHGYHTTVPDPENPGQTIPNPQTPGEFTTLFYQAHMNAEIREYHQRQLYLASLEAPAPAISLIPGVTVTTEPTT
jgi:hypothetical protein